MLLETIEITRSQGIIKTREVPKIWSESVGKCFKANSENSSGLSGLHRLLIYHCITQSHKFKCLKQQQFCILMILWAEIGTEHSRNSLSLFHLFHMTYAETVISNIVPLFIKLDPQPGQLGNWGPPGTTVSSRGDGSQVGQGKIATFRIGPKLVQQQSPYILF